MREKKKKAELAVTKTISMPPKLWKEIEKLLKADADLEGNLSRLLRRALDLYLSSMAPK